MIEVMIELICGGIVFLACVGVMVYLFTREPFISSWGRERRKQSGKMS